MNLSSPPTNDVDLDSLDADRSVPGAPAVVNADEFWDRHAVDVGGTLTFRLGPLTLCATRHPREWRFCWWRDSPPLEDRSHFSDSSALLSEAPEDASRARFAFQTSPARLTLVPVLADRLMVAKPEIPLTLPPRESVKLYLSTPIWLRVVVEGDDRKHERFLWEEPTVRPSDTWFGDRPIVGEMAYASLTHARLSLAEVLWLPQRVVTEVDVVNDTNDELQLPRLSIPVRALSIHIDKGGRLWSPAVSLRRTSDGSLADLSVLSVPAAAGTTRKLGESRDPPQSRNVVRAFASLFAG